MQELGAAPGTAAAGFFGYMVGVHNELALRHIPEVAPRADTLAGPAGRRGDQVRGGEGGTTASLGPAAGI